MNDLKNSWLRATNSLGIPNPSTDVFEHLMICYAEPQRKYHNIQHIRECIEKFEPTQEIAIHPSEIEMAIWFHDAVYDVRSHDNECQSAIMARNFLADSGVGREPVQRIFNLILATQHAVPPENPDAMLLVDIDLSILGAPETRFLEYELQIRGEYAWVEEQTFRKTRRDILKSFLDRERIFNTPFFANALETAARRNLSRVIASSYPTEPTKILE